MLAGVGSGLLAGYLGDDHSKPPKSQLADCDRPDETLRLASSTEKSGILADLAHAYGAHSSHGSCVRVTVDGVDSGVAMEALARGWNTRTDGPAPDVWSPASQVWLQIARQRAGGEAVKKLPTSVNADASIVSSPLTIAMPEQTAERFGWPDKKISWNDLASFVRKDRGFKLGKTNPERSTSGLNATIAAFYTRTGTTGELVPADLDNPDNQQEVRTIEKAAVHYGDTTLTFLANLRRYDDAGQATSYVSAVTVEENSVVAYNEGYPCGSRSTEPGCAKTTPPRTKLVAFYPANADNVGTMYSDHPYIKLNGGSSAKNGVADDFRHFLASKEALDRFADLGFRTPSHKPTSGITRAHGALPDVPLPGPLNPPSDDVLSRLLTVWRKLRKPANVLVLIDTSGSMDKNAQDQGRVPGEPSKLDLVKKAHGPLLDGFTDTDKVGLWHFSGRHVTDEDIAPMGSKAPGGTTHRERLEADVDDLSPEGATALYGTIDDAVKSLRGHYDPDAINAVVVLTDGVNETNGGPDLETLVSTVGDPDKPPVRVFTIAYGHKADKNHLQQIAEAAHAQAYDASDPNSIANVLSSVISNF